MLDLVSSLVAVAEIIRVSMELLLIDNCELSIHDSSSRFTGSSSDAC